VRENEDEEEMPELDYADPLKRDREDDDEDPDGADPALTIPPED